MRESRIEEYDPGFRSPFYPWVQIIGIIATIWLIAEMGWISILFTAGMVLACVFYYNQFLKEKIEWEGAIYHIHARLGKYRYEALEREMRGIMREKGLRKEDPYEKVTGRALVFDYPDEEAKENRKLYAMIFLVSSKKKSGQHLRILAHLAEMIDSIDFTDRWLSAEDPAELREILLRDERFINIIIKQGDITEEMIGKTIRELELPGESLITIIKRQGEIIFPHGQTIIQEDDELSIIGETEDIDQLNQTVSDSGNDN